VVLAECIAVRFAGKRWFCVAYLRQCLLLCRFSDAGCTSVYAPHLAGI
jgi:hypothetical protein